MLHTLFKIIFQTQNTGDFWKITLVMRINQWQIQKHSWERLKLKPENSLVLFWKSFSPVSIFADKCMSKCITKLVLVDFDDNIFDVEKCSIMKSICRLVWYDNLGLWEESFEYMVRNRLVKYVCGEHYLN